MIKYKEFKKRYFGLKKRWKKINDRGNHQVLNNRVKYVIKLLNDKVVQPGCKSMNLLDLGCNNGVYSTVAAGKFKYVFGIDPDKKRKGMTKKSIATAKYFKVSNCSFYDMTFSDYVNSGTYVKNDINAIMAFQVLHHLDDNEIQILYDSLKDISLFIIGTHPIMSERIRPGKPANKLGLYNVKQVINLFSDKYTTVETYNEGTRWPTVLLYN